MPIINPFTIVAAIGLKKYLDFMRDYNKPFQPYKSNKPITYVSLFTGIGAFEVGMRSVLPNAKCLAFAEKLDWKRKIYLKHFPNHPEYNDVKIVPSIKADLLVGGPSCKSKSALAATSMKYLKQDKSMLALGLLLKVIKEGNYKDVIIENVPGSTVSDATTNIIQQELQQHLGKEIFVNTFNACPLSGSSRRRTFFTTFPIVLDMPKIIKRFEFDLEPYSDVKYGFNEEISYLTESKEFNTYITERKVPKEYLHPFERKKHIVDFLNSREGMDRWSFGSDTNKECSSALVTASGRYPSGIVVDRRGGDPLARMMTVGEGERLMGFPKNYLKGIPVSKAFYALGDSIVVQMAEFMLANYTIHLAKNKNR